MVSNLKRIRSMSYYDDQKKKVQSVVFTGPSNSGKTSLINTYLKQKFRPNYQNRIPGVEFSSKAISRRNSLNIWDTTGCEKYDTITNYYYRKADVVILVVDASDKRSVSSIRHWVSKIKQHTRKNIIIVANKVDLLKKGNESYVKEDPNYVLLSSKNVASVNHLFDKILRTISFGNE